MSGNCPDCYHILQHHYDDGCARCDCRTSNTEAGYRAMMLAERAWAQYAAERCDASMGEVPLDAHHGAGSWPPLPGDGCER